MDVKIGQIDKALNALGPHLSECRLCPRECAADRRSGGSGFCGGGDIPRVSHTLLHFGEEPVISGTSDCREPAANRPSGSGTVFFSGCNLRCLFCQNHQISWEPSGDLIHPEDLAEKFLDLQSRGALNINLVSPTIWIIPILETLRMAFRHGLSIPVIWNSGGYEKADILRHLDGIIDIYLPDLKYMSSSASEKYSHAKDYFKFASAALLEMACQQPVFRESAGSAKRGLIVRHLVLPALEKDSLALLDWMEDSLPPTAALSLMSQYHPCFKAPSEIRRLLQPEEYSRVLERARRMDIDTLFYQPRPFGREEHLFPDFGKRRPFLWTK